MLKAIIPVVALAAMFTMPPTSQAETQISSSTSDHAATSVTELAAASRSHGGGGGGAKSHASGGAKSHARSGGAKSHAGKSGGQKHAQSSKGGQKHVNKSKGGGQKQAHTPKQQGGKQAHNKPQHNNPANNGGKKVAHKPLQNGPGKNKQAGKHMKSGPGKNTKIVDHWKGWAKPAHVNIYRGNRRIWIADGWRTFVPIVAIGAWAWGADTLWADGYVSVASNACYGPTGDGCRLRWQQVDLVEGGTDFQCVQFCKQRNRTVAEVDLSADETTGSAQAANPQDAGQGAQAAARACDMTIYESAEFKGLSAQNQEDQPTLADDGWKDEISSIQINSGTWDFFTNENYAGDTMRLKAGQYAKLDPAWTKKIGSFLCNTSMASQ
jgi:hypothetical protein